MADDKDEARDAAGRRVIERCRDAQHANVWSNYALTYVPALCTTCQDYLDEIDQVHAALADATERERALTELVGLLRDEHHPPEELYEYRMLYNAHAVNEWVLHGTYPVVKSLRHSDGAPCFDGEYFIVVASLPTGQVSNHYRTEYWDAFDVPEVDLPPVYDGHTPQVAAQRLRAALPLPVGDGTC